MVDHNIFVRVKALHLCNHAFGVLFLCIMLLVVDIVNEVEDGLGQINGDFNNLGWIGKSARYPAHSGSCNCKYLRYLFCRLELPELAQKRLLEHISLQKSKEGEKLRRGNAYWKCMMVTDSRMTFLLCGWGTESVNGRKTFCMRLNAVVIVVVG